MNLLTMNRYTDHLFPAGINIICVTVFPGGRSCTAKADSKKGGVENLKRALLNNGDKVFPIRR